MIKQFDQGTEIKFNSNCARTFFFIICEMHENFKIKTNPYLKNQLIVELIPQKRQS